MEKVPDTARIAELEEQLRGVTRQRDEYFVEMQGDWDGAACEVCGFPCLYGSRHPTCGKLLAELETAQQRVTALEAEAAQLRDWKAGATGAATISHPPHAATHTEHAYCDHRASYLSGSEDYRLGADTVASAVQQATQRVAELEAENDRLACDETCGDVVIENARLRGEVAQLRGGSEPLLPKLPEAERTGRRVDVDGRVDEDRGINCIGHAWEMTDGTWRCLAGVRGMLCIVEVKITPTEGPHVEDDQDAVHR